MTPQDEEAIVLVEREAGAPFVAPETQLPPSVPVKPKPQRPVLQPAPSNTTTYAPKLMPLPEGQSGRYEEPRQHYYEGESCTGSGGYYDDGYYEDDGCSSNSGSSSDSDTVYVGSGGGDDDDDDDSAPPPTTSGDDDDDGDDDVDIEWGDDDDDDDELQRKLENKRSKEIDVSPVQTQTQKLGAIQRRHNPFSRLALLGVLIAFPLRRRFRSP